MAGQSSRYMRVDLPEPERPTIAANSPFQIDSPMFDRARTVALPDVYCFETPTILTSGSGTSKPQMFTNEATLGVQDANDQRLTFGQGTLKQSRAVCVALSDANRNRQRATVATGNPNDCRCSDPRDRMRRGNDQLQALIINQCIPTPLP